MTNFIRVLTGNVVVNVFKSDAVTWWAAVSHTFSLPPSFLQASPESTHPQRHAGWGTACQFRWAAKTITTKLTVHPHAAASAFDAHHDPLWWKIMCPLWTLITPRRGCRPARRCNPVGTGMNGASLACHGMHVVGSQTRNSFLPQTCGHLVHFTELIPDNLMHSSEALQDRRPEWTCWVPLGHVQRDSGNAPLYRRG